MLRGMRRVVAFSLVVMGLACACVGSRGSASTSTALPTVSATATTPSGPADFDRFTFCEMAGTVDDPQIDPRWQGVKQPPQLAAVLYPSVAIAPGMPFDWRCDGGRVLACVLPMAGRAGCAKLFPDKLPLLPEITASCQTGPDGDPPSYLTSYSSIWRWSCKDHKPVLYRAVEPDSRGYHPQTWEVIQRPKSP